MADFNGRPNHIEDVLMTYRAGPWCTWTDIYKKTYANLILVPKVQDFSYTGDSPGLESLIDNPYTLPSELELTTKLQEMQDDWDLEYAGYKQNRRDEYLKVGEQLDQLYHDMTAGKLDATGEWHKSIKAVKDKYSKG